MEIARLLGWLIALGLLKCAGAQQEIKACFRGSEFIFVNDPVFPQEALDNCLARNANLAVPSNEEEQKFILSLIEPVGLLFDFWLGKFSWLQFFLVFPRDRADRYRK